MKIPCLRALISGGNGEAGCNVGTGFVSYTFSACNASHVCNLTVSPDAPQPTHSEKFLHI